eukprot:scaffold14296_cov60-Phaeocystis_antarctica.AAC.2
MRETPTGPGGAHTPKVATTLGWHDHIDVASRGTTHRPHSDLVWYYFISAGQIGASRSPRATTVYRAPNITEQEKRQTTKQPGAGSEEGVASQCSRRSVEVEDAILARVL